MATESAISSADSPSRRRWTFWGAVLLVALLVLVALHPGLRSLARDTWREMRSILPVYLALIFLLKTGQSLFSALTWSNALRSAWPDSMLPYRFVLGVEQGQVAVNTVAPARAGTWAMLGIFRASIQGARATKLAAVWGVQNLAFLLFAAINYTLVAVGLPEGRAQGGGVTDRISGLFSSRPLLAAAIGVAIVVALVLAFIVVRRRITEFRQQVREATAILHPPVRYVRTLFLPSLISYAFNCASYVVLLAAFGIPVTIWTVALALGSNALAGAVRITPGGVGTSQAIDVLALRAYAPANVVTAYSLSEIAITAVVSTVLTVVALASASGWRGIRVFLRHLRRGELSAGLHALGARQRALGVRALRRRKARGG